MKKLTPENIIDEIKFYDSTLEITDEMVRRIEKVMVETPVTIPGYLSYILETAIGDALNPEALYIISKNTAKEYASIFLPIDFSDESKYIEDDEDEDEFEM